MTNIETLIFISVFTCLTDEKDEGTLRNNNRIWRVIHVEVILYYCIA